ncbi:vanadium-dependent haloperoxidase [Kitasatospora brasiliensis]|uniref:vanadium-dependent haloperoxidase n=1 Tax=Kitasatospora brasiliensis TaxID=3058040 RepID=UPI002931155D|nr:vanadium-dependent haloperoxidase [Kitasatospora sp. K002]
MNRRSLLRSTAALSAALGLTAAESGLSTSYAAAESATEDARMNERTRIGRELRRQAAEQDYPATLPAHPVNGEETSLPGRLGSYSKGLPHNDLGEVDGQAYNLMLKALASGKPADFEAIPMAGERKQLGPQGGLAYDLAGPDFAKLVVPPAPRMDSAHVAAEMAELYWMGLLRDVKFTDFEDSALAAAAAADLSTYSDGRMPKQAGKVTPHALFRGQTPADLVGPYISQFLLRPVQYGTLRVPQLHDTVQPGVDFGTEFGEWLALQRGAARTTQRDFTRTRHLQTPRDLAHYTHFDVLYQAYLNAALIMLGLPQASVQDQGNPYLGSKNQMGFPTYGTPHLVSLLAEVAVRAIKHTEYQQFFVHRRLRPEVFAGRIEVHKRRSPGRYAGLLPGEILDSEVLERNLAAHGSYLLPQVFPEGSPMSPSYQSGHGTVAGACTTVLKAWFNESYVLTDAVVPSADGTSLVPYTGADKDSLTIGGELNKLAANIGASRACSGVHYRSDNTEAFALGETIAIEMMRAQKTLFNEGGGFSLTRFDGTTVTI